MCVDNVSTIAFVNTGTTVSVKSLSYKTRLGQKVTFSWKKLSSFFSVSGDTLCPVGICTTDVCLCGKVFTTEIAVISGSTHDVISGLDFLRAISYGQSGELSVHHELMTGLVENSPRQEGAFCVCRMW